MRKGVVSGRRKYDHVADVRGALGWLSAADLSAYDTLVLLHRVICSEEPAALAGRFQRNEEMRERLTRQNGQLSLPRIRTESGKRTDSKNDSLLCQKIASFLGS